MNNLLREPGAIVLAGVAIDLRKIAVPSYFVATIEDHIAPWKSAYLGARLLNGPTRFVLGGSGHVAGIVNPPAADRYGYWVNASMNLPDCADEWFGAAKLRSGSWWIDWHSWLKRRNGKKQVAARDPSTGKLEPIDDTPGDYVNFRLETAKKS